MWGISRHIGPLFVELSLWFVTGTSMGSEDRKGTGYNFTRRLPYNISSNQLFIKNNLVWFG